MRISWNWLSEMVDLTGVNGPKGLADLLTARGLEVEDIERQDRGFEKVVTAQILERNQHPQADRLSLCKVTIGQGEPLEIVCGAQNMKAGDKVALAQIGAELPNGLKIAQSKIRGVTSNGMLCSEEELGLKNESEGILILPPSTALGKPLAQLLGRDDTILVFKLTANRGDCLSHWGMAREVAAALGKKPKRPEAKMLDFSSGAKSPVSIQLNAGESAPQFYGCSIEGVKIGPSPDWMVKRLEALGSRSINNVVDASNWVMLELGHPTHAYDATRIKGGKIQVRQAKQGEELPLLDGKAVTLQGTELVIGDAERAIGLAGVMGGGNSEVQDSTTKLFLECAEFDPRLVRRASSRHQRKTDAAHRFERGIDPQALDYVISRLATLIVQLAGGKVIASSAAFQGARGPKYSPRKIRLKPEYFENFLGAKVPAAKAEQLLTALDCKVEKSGDTWQVTAPSYRLDLGRPEDLAEEVARTLGYDAIPETIPPLSSPPSPIESTAGGRLKVMDRAKAALAQAGLSEAVNYAFTSRSWLEKFGLKSSALVLNPLSEEHEALVPSLLPGLIRSALENWNHHFGSEPLSLRLFEIRPTFHAAGPISAQGEMATPVQEKWRLSFVLSGPRFSGGLRNQQGELDFSDIKAVFENLIETLGARGVRMQPLANSREAQSPLAQLFHPGQSVEVLAGKDSAGFMGLLHPAQALELKIREPLWVGELDWDALSKLSIGAEESRQFQPWFEFPPMERDFALLVKDEVTGDKITQVALKAGKPLAKIAKIFDVYRGAQVAQGMTSVAVRVIFYDETRSLQESEAEAASSRILESWKKELGAELRG